MGVNNATRAMGHKADYESFKENYLTHEIIIYWYQSTKVIMEYTFSHMDESLNTECPRMPLLK